MNRSLFILSLLACPVLSHSLSYWNAGGGGSSSSSGLSVGSSVSGGAANAVLYEDSTQALAADGTDLTFDGAILTAQQMVIFGTGTSTALSITQAGSNDAGIDLAVGTSRYKIAADNSVSGDPFIIGHCVSATACEPVDELGILSYVFSTPNSYMTFGSRTLAPHTHYAERRGYDFYAADNANSSSIIHLWGSRGGLSGRIGALVANNAVGNDSATDRITGSIEFFTGASDVDEGSLSIFLHNDTTSLVETMRLNHRGEISIGANPGAPTTNLYVFENTTDTNPTVEIENTGTGDAAVQFSAGTTGWAIGNDNSDNDSLVISSAAGVGTAALGTNNIVKITTGGAVLIGTNVSTNTTTKLNVTGVDNSIVVISSINANQADITAADTFVGFFSNEGLEGSIAGTAAAGVIAFNTFTGSHWTKIDGKLPEVLTPLESTGEPYEEGKDQLVKSKPCKTKRSKAILGFYGGTDEQGRSMALALGTGLAWVSNKGAPIEIGDWLVTSDVAGTVEKQGDETKHSYTVAKALQPIKWKKGEKKRKIAVTYHCG